MIIPKIGLGVDVHRFAPGESVVLGGVEIPCEFSLLGHSDADVLVHAIMDSLLGAAGKGDIGTHFPPSDPAYKGISSILLLRRVCKLLEQEHFSIGNINAMVITEIPKLGPYREQMIQSIENVTGENTVSLQFTTSETLGFVGRKEGILSIANAIIFGTG